MRELENRMTTTEQEREVVSVYAKKRAYEYLHLAIGRDLVPTPFYSNDVGLMFSEAMVASGMDLADVQRAFAVYNQNGLPYGWYRGKGTPEQLVQAANLIANQWDIDLTHAPQQVVVEFMKAAGLGIDCSGFAFNILDYAYGKVGRSQEFRDSLDWVNGDRSVYKAGVYSFDGGSVAIDYHDVKPLDIVVVKGVKTDKFAHIAVVLEDGGGLNIAHSVIGQVPTGVHFAQIDCSNGLPYFGFKPNLTPSWEDLYTLGKIQFKRLNINL
jgi:hypothetical protein